MRKDSALLMEDLFGTYFKEYPLPMISHPSAHIRRSFFSASHILSADIQSVR